EHLVEDGLDPDLLHRWLVVHVEELVPHSSSPPAWPLAYLASMCCATTLGTKAETSPPKRATSRTSLEATKDHSGLVGMKIVSTPERGLFICAICISASKSETARSPRTMAVGPTSRATLTSRVDTDTMRTDGRCDTTSSSISWRSSRSKSAVLFCGLRSAAT